MQIPMLKYPQFQLEDIPRLAILDGAICAWEQGLGKSIAAITLALIKQARRILLVAPDDLHAQHKESAMKFFHVHLTTLEKIEQLAPFGLALPHPDDAPPRFFITSFHNLGFNNADEWLSDVQGDALAKTKGARGKARLYELEQLLPADMRARPMRASNSPSTPSSTINSSPARKKRPARTSRQPARSGATALSSARRGCATCTAFGRSRRRSSCAGAKTTAACPS